MTQTNVRDIDPDLLDQYPYRSVVYIEAVFPNGAVGVASGFVVGRNDILTSGHVVYDGASGGAAVSVTVYPGRDGDFSPYGGFEAVNLDFFDQFDPNNDGLLSRTDSEFDFAVIATEEPIGDTLGQFNLDPSSSSGFYSTTGYPGFLDGVLTTDSGFIPVDRTTGTYSFTGTEVFPGNSGGPLWYPSADGATAVGVVSTGGWASDVAAQFDTINAWIAGNDKYLVEGLPAEDAQMVALLYEAALNRNGNIDIDGLNFWIDQRTDGLSEIALANEFLEAQEFEEAFGDPDTLAASDFVELFYENILNRPGDTDGVAFWTDVAEAPGYDTAQLLLDFVSSQENTDELAFIQTLTETGPGYWEFV